MRPARQSGTIFADRSSARSVGRWRILSSIGRLFSLAMVANAPAAWVAFSNSARTTEAFGLLDTLVAL